MKAKYDWRYWLMGLAFGFLVSTAITVFHLPLAARIALMFLGGLCLGVWQFNRREK